jgi:MoaA/NifB/PqqE/SkfB family radical SAM enzyme
VDHNAKVNEMNTEQLLKLVDELAEAGTKMIVFLGGEFSIVKDIDKVIDRITEKGMVCDAVTNGLLLPKKIDIFKKLDSICVSMDGLGEANDVTRGKGTSKKVMEAIKVARDNGIVVRVNCVITRNNVNNYHDLLKWAKKENILVTFGMPFEDEIKDMLLNDQEMRNFYHDLKKLKKKGFPILFSDEAIEYMEEYPGSPADFVMQSQKKDSSIQKRYKLKCPYGRFIAYMHSNGMMLPCNNLYKINDMGPNILEVGVKQAWDNLGNLNCLSCYEAGIPEWNHLTSLSGIWKGVMLTLKQTVRR